MGGNGIDGGIARIPHETKTPRSTWAATEVSSENDSMMSDSTMLAFRCLGLCFFFGVQGGPLEKQLYRLQPQLPTYNNSSYNC